MGFRHCKRRENTALTDQTKEFCHRYCVHFDRVRAYQEVFGVDVDKAKINARNLFKKANVVDYIDSILRERKQSVIEINVDKLIGELNAIALCRIDDVIDLNSGEILPEIEGDALAAVSEFTLDEFENEQVSKRKRRIKLSDKQKAIELLLRIQGYTTELPQALRVLEAYGVKLKQNESGEWVIEK